MATPVPGAPQHNPGLQPSTHGSQRDRPGHLWSRCFFLADFFPGSCTISRNLLERTPFPCKRLWNCLLHQCQRVAGVVPTEGESATDQLPMPSNCLVAPDLILGPAQSVFDLLVALLRPLAQPREPDHFFQEGWRKRQWRHRMLDGSRQIRHEIPGDQIGQRLWISRGNGSPLRFVRPRRSCDDL